MVNQETRIFLHLVPPRSPFLPVYALAVALVLPWGMVTSCASYHRKPPSSEPPPAATETRVGVVRAVGGGQRYVLIETASALSASALSEGQLLHTRPPDDADRTMTADLRVSRERHQALVVANVVAGEPAVGAVVYTSPGALLPAATPGPDSVSSVATAPLPGLFPPRKP